MLAARNVTVRRGPKVVLDGVDLSVDAGSRIGVLGRNGAGKSTLLRVLAGLEAPTSGAVERAPVALTVGYLTQEVDPLPGETTAAYLRRRTGLAGAEAALDRATAALERAAGPAELAAYDAALAGLLALGGDDHDVRVPRVLADLGLPAGLEERPLRQLSGGQQVKVNLSAVLLSRFDVLLLDEPTNNLDFDGLERLGRFLDSAACGVVLVSHDRALLGDHTTRIAEIDFHSHRLEEFGGGFTAYMEERRLRREQAYARFESAREERTRLEGSMRQRKEWSVSQRGQRKKDKDKALAARQKERSESAAAGARALETRIQRLSGVEKPWEGWELRMTLRTATRSGDVVATLGGAVVERGRFRLGPVDLELRWRDRVALTGPNGAGKSTLVELLTGRLPAAAGIARLGPGVVVGILRQDRAAVGDTPVPGGSLLDAVMAATGLKAQEARSLLAKFDLGAEHAVRGEAALSPGERSRAALAVLMARGTNFLVLDEPTNHLDLEAIEALERALEDFDGTLLVVTHDRRLLESLRLNRRFDVAAGAVAEVEPVSPGARRS
ncbi:MAG TPA: ABC-F family ATP-binding cassette domain-containing protein [Acidimicrobiia bacterium]|nr:ABC-F family ATP-binding cassette domain-containing protein [Acidimicrobiia bacterium]